MAYISKWNGYDLKDAEARVLIADLVARVEALEGGAEPEEIINYVPLSTDTTGAIYNGVGYKDGYRLSSSGSEKADTGGTTTGFIPCGKGVVRLTGVAFGSWSADGSDTIESKADGWCYIALYDSNYTKLISLAASYFTDGNTYGVDVEWGSVPNALATDVVTVDLSNCAYDVAYIRLTARGSGADMVVTVNQEIK